MTTLTAFCFAAASQALTAFTLGFTDPSEPIRAIAAIVVALITLCFTIRMQDALPNRLHLALLVSGMWIQCLKSFDDLCLSRLSFEGLNASPSVTERLKFGLRQLWNMRGVGTTKEISQIPPWSRKAPLFTPTRSQAIRRHARNAILSYLILDIFANQRPSDPDMLSPSKETLLTRLGEVGLEEAIFRFFVVFSFWISAFCCIQFINSVLSLIYVGLNLYPVSMLPPIWGRLSDCYTVRRFWGKFWHQTLRRHLTSLSEHIIHDILHMSKGLLSRYSKLIICFLISGVVHSSSDTTLGIPVEESNSVTYFVTTALVIMCEDGVQHVFRGVRGNWSRWFGYFWVLCYMYVMTPSWGYPAARAVRPQDQMVSFSLIKQFMS
ncbi:hypothetical protein F53441_677 [Fusarium austroafricanum]|uniref:Wax synthase domain-containing protein n=1 Tax=Fusarium austroafricanum TaxID=2364996 RepID=A0A8H4KXU9_9HYPO|nr:hypothetical protein F53441_677 [Fusarium austroafricanum]